MHSGNSDKTHAVYKCQPSSSSQTDHKASAELFQATDCRHQEALQSDDHNAPASLLTFYQSTII